MTNIKKYMMVATMGLLGSALIGCSTPTEEVYIYDLYQRVYLSTAAYPHIEGSYSCADVMMDPALYFDSNSYLQYTEGGLVSTVKGDKDYTIYLHSTYAVERWNVEGTLVVCEDADDVIANYNTQNNLYGDDAYGLLPAEFYTVINDKSTIEIGRKEGDVPFEISLNDDLSQLPAGHYVLPLTCSLTEESCAQMSSSMGVFMLKVDYTFTDERTGEVGEAHERPLTYNTDFTARLITGSNYSGPTGGNVASLFDGNPSTGQLCTSSQYYVDYTITFTKPVKLTRVGYVNFGLNGIGWGYDYAPYQVCYQFTDADDGSTTWSDWYNCPRSADNYFDIIDHDKPISSLRIEFYGYNYMGADEICLIVSTDEE